MTHRFAQYRFEAVLSAAVLVLLSAGPSRACDCIPTSVENAYNEADVVFRGVVLAHRIRQGDPGFSDNRLFNIEVLTVWKGAIGDRLGLVTPTDSANCGILVVEGDTVIVYASIDPATGELTSSSCQSRGDYGGPDSDIDELASLGHDPYDPFDSEDPNFPTYDVGLGSIVAGLCGTGIIAPLSLAMCFAALGTRRNRIRSTRVHLAPSTSSAVKCIPRSRSVDPVPRPSTMALSLSYPDPGHQRRLTEPRTRVWDRRAHHSRGGF